MITNMLSRAAAIGAFLLAGAPFALAQPKIAVVKFQEALLGTAEIKKAQGELQQRYKPRQEEIERLSKELQDINARLADPSKLSQVGISDLQAQGQRKQTRLQRLNQDIEEEFNRDRQEILTRASQHMSEVIKKIADEKGFDLVLDATSTLFSKNALDITPEVTQAYDKAYPVK
jgi:outer membrane protein